VELDDALRAIALRLEQDGAITDAGSVRWERQASGGRSNTTSIARAGDQRFVVRMPPAGRDATGEQAMLREYRYLSLLTGTSVPVPAPLAAGVVEMGEERVAFCASRFVEGQPPQDATGQTARWLMQPARKRRYLLDAARLLGELHGLNWRARGVPARDRDYLTRQLERWSYRLDDASVAANVTGIERVTSWLKENRPPSPPDVLTHGDYGLHNALLTMDGSDRIAAVLDWELAAVGNPLCDLAWFETQLGPIATDWGNPAAAMMSGRGVPPLAEIERVYQTAGGVDVADMAYYRIFAMWKAVALWASLYASARTGTGDSFAHFLAARVPDRVVGLVKQLPV
jgi:aminoglycoside phosphotransferase (APT) family kinase protein